MNQLCSIIIPVYNEEKNIEKCFEVIQSQTYKAIEAIFVNDGSTDNSENIIIQVAAKYPDLKIKLINQENQGAASARKNGVMHASGNFIAILDCDDELSKDAINEAMTNFNTEVDIVLFNLKYKSEVNGEVVLNDFIYYTSKSFFCGRDALKNSLERWGVHGLGVYRKDILMCAYIDYEEKNTKNYINNDEVITRLAFYYSRLIKVSDGIYFYNNNLQSTTKRINKELYKKIFNSIILYKILSSKDKSEVSPAVIIVYAWEAGKYLFFNRKSLKNIENWKSAISDATKFIWRNSLFGDLSSKRRIQFLILVIMRYFVQ